MLKRKYRIIITFITISALIFGCLKRTDGLKQTDIWPVLKIFLSRHVQYHEFDDEISERTLSNLINYLDPGKFYFFKSDVEDLLKDKSRLDDYIKADKYDFISKILLLYKKRFTENLDLFHKLIKNKYNFNKDESIIIDREKTDYATTKKEMQERWRKNIKLQLLNQYSVEKNIAKAKKKLKKKYNLLEKRVDEIDLEKARAIFINAFTTALDPHSNYLTREEHEDFMISTKLKLEGIGVLLRSEDGFVSVESIVPGGAADKLPDELKLKPNDKIVAVAQADGGEPVDVIDMALRDVVKLIRGDKGTVVKLTVLREVHEKDAKSRMIIPITREEIKLQDRAAKSEVYPYKKNKSNIRIGYLKLPSFYLDFDAYQNNDPDARSSSNDVITQLKSLKSKEIDGLVLDLRGNPGGALKEAVNIVGMFIDKGPVVQIFNNSNNIQVMKDRSPGVNYNGPIVLLINKFSASASEIFAGALKDYNRGIVIGSNSTFGKGTVQTYNVLPGNMGAMKITTAIFYQPAGSSNQLNGIEPDITIPDLTSIWDMGEDKLHNPLKWDKIKRSNFVSYKKFKNSKILSKITRSSSKRIKSNKKFQDLIKKIKNLKEKRKKKTISLKEESEIENDKKKDIEKKKKDQSKKKLIDLENDLFLQEALNITADYIEILR